MDVKQKYIREAGFDIADDFIETLGNLDIRTSKKIVRFMDKKIDHIDPNLLVSTLLPGLIIDDDDNPVTFVLEIIKDFSPNIILSDIQLIEMDEYLDLINLNKKLNDRTANKRSKKNNRRRLQG
jgi:predicted transcriptional regulator|tara:strand:+ start:1190 stop:1561 length:372 start_codon:yes stop_codon:yes gene_type:complete